jgi:dTDP-4-dehydrorhamnose reductase
VRVFVTGASGFIGSNVVELFRARGAEVFAERVELRDAASVRENVATFRPDAIVHTAILNDFATLYRDRALAWDSYVGATRNVVDAANAAGAIALYVSTDWVFDGTQHLATEDSPPNPVNLYGVLKAMSELVVLERAQRGVVARVAGVNGSHRARPAPRAQDPGFGYFVASLVDALSDGRPFTVWESDTINMVATPSLASECAALFWRALEREVTGVLHCCGGEAVTRMQLARQACEVFELDPSLVHTGPPEQSALLPAPVPYDTSLDAHATSRRLGTELPSVRELLVAFRREVETGELQPLTAIG